VNKLGNTETLVASHPGNMNAVKHGVHSQCLIESRAAEVTAQLTQSVEFSPQGSRGDTQGTLPHTRVRDCALV
jgi:hypothetical protein